VTSLVPLPLPAFVVNQVVLPYGIGSSSKSPTHVVIFRGTIASNIMDLIQGALQNECGGMGSCGCEDLGVECRERRALEEVNCALPPKLV
jgi:hypothetical protein